MNSIYKCFGFCHSPHCSSIHKLHMVCWSLLAIFHLQILSYFKFVVSAFLPMHKCSFICGSYSHVQIPAYCSLICYAWPNDQKIICGKLSYFFTFQYINCHIRIGPVNGKARYSWKYETKRNAYITQSSFFLTRVMTQLWKAYKTQC